MADSGLVRFLGGGIRFAPNKAASTYVGFRLASAAATSFYLNLPTALPGTTQALTVDPSGNLSYASLGGGGTVTSVGLAVPNDLSVTAPITSSGTITISRNSQAQATFLAAPAGAAGVPSYRAIASADIPQTLTTSWITNFASAVQATALNQFAVPTANLNLNNFRITGLADPTSNTDAATKSYVDAIAAGDSNKGTARVASTANLNLAAPGATIDGVTMVAGDVVLVKDQTTASQNGIYIWNGAAVPMTRATNADISAEVRPGLFAFVSEGAVNANNGYTLTTPAPITLGTTNLAFTQTSGAGQISAGAGMTKTGNQLDVVGTTNRIAVNSDSIDIASTYAGQSSITTLGTIGTGTWNGTTIAVANGGTGATTPTAARANLGATGVFRQSFTNAALTSGILTVTHNLGQQYVLVKISDENNKVVPTVDDITLSTANTLTIDLTSFGTLAGTWNVVVVG